MLLSSTSHIPPTPGVYLFKSKKDEILYIGKAKNLHKRVQQYFTPGSVWKQEMVALAERVEFIEVASESDALSLEENLIKQHLPEYNKLLRHNSNAIYIKFTKEDFPAVTITRYRNKDKATYVGPKQNSKELRKLMQYLRQIFKYRTTSSTEFQKGVLTTDYYLGLDAGRSIIAKLKQKNGNNYLAQAEKLGFKLEKNYEEYKTEYNTMIEILKKFFDGDIGAVLNHLKSSIVQAASLEQYERCAQLRDIYHYIEILGEKQEVVFKQPVTGSLLSIHQVHAYWVMIFVKIFDGKIVDIIRERIPADEQDLENIVASFKAEMMSLGHSERSEESLSGQPTTNNQQVRSFLDRKLTKIEVESLHSLLEKSLQSYISSTLFEEDNLINQLLIGLKEKYGLSKVPFHIECIDISHLSGGRVSGGLSCFKSGVPYPKGYRKYKINTVEHGKSDDYQSLREVVTRRMLSEPYPDLLIIDGGLGQINAVVERLTKIFGSTPSPSEAIGRGSGGVIPCDLVSIGKGDARKRAGKIRGEKEVLYKFESTHSLISQFEITYDPLDLLLLKTRDEAHRFSNKYRKEQMRKEITIL